MEQLWMCFLSIYLENIKEGSMGELMDYIELRLKAIKEKEKKKSKKVKKKGV